MSRLETPRMIAVGIRSTIKTFLPGLDRVSAEPHLSDESIAALDEVLTHQSVLVEYGAGGSTIRFASKAGLLISVENDRRWARSVTAAVSRENSHNVRVLYRSLGLSTTWGNPLFRSPTPRRNQRWEQYVNAPWEAIASLQRPDQSGPVAVLVDGRLRVASAIRSLLAIDATSAHAVFVDDYDNRPHYRAIEKFTVEIGHYGRMRAFVKRTDFDDERAYTLLKSALEDHR